MDTELMPNDHGSLAHMLTALRDEERRTGRNNAARIAAILKAWEAAR